MGNWVAEGIENSVTLLEYTFPKDADEKDIWAPILAGEVALNKGHWDVDTMMGPETKRSRYQPEQRRRGQKVAAPEEWLNTDAPYRQGVASQMWLQLSTPRKNG